MYLAFLVYNSVSTFKKPNKKKALQGVPLWSHMGSNHGPPDYESGALTN